MKIAVVNTKGGASKSTVSFQVASTYFLEKNLEVKLIEFDDENKDSEHFEKSKIISEQIEVGTGDGLNDMLRTRLLNNDNLVLDIGGNKTTTLMINALSATRMHRKIDLFIIPMSGGSQDVINAFKTHKMILAMNENAKVIFALSRVRNLKRLSFQYKDFFSSDISLIYKHFILQDSDVIDLSRNEKKSVYEIALDAEYKKKLDKLFDKSMDDNDMIQSARLSTLLEIIDEASIYYKTNLKVAYALIDEVTAKDIVAEEKKEEK